MIFCLSSPQFSSLAFRVYEGLDVVVIEQGKVVSVPPQLSTHLVGIPKAQFISLHPDFPLKVQDMHIEKAVWEDVLLRLYKLTPLIESPQLGLAYVSASKEKEHELKEIITEFQFKAGGAQYKEMAFIASLKAVSGFLLYLTPGNKEDFLRSCDGSLLRLAGFPPKMVERLDLLGFTTLLEVSTLSKRQLQVQFREEGIRLYQLLHPQDKRISTWFRPPDILEVYIDNDDDIEELYFFEQWILSVAEQLHKQLERRVARVLEITVSYSDATIQRKIRVFQDPLFTKEEIARGSDLLWRQCAHHIRIKRLFLRLKQLETPTFEQQMLFHRPELTKAIQRLENRFPGTLLRSVYRQYALFSEEQYELRKY